MSMTNFKLFGSDIIVDLTPDSSTDYGKALVPAKEEPIDTIPIFPNPNPNPSSSSGVSTDLCLGSEITNSNGEGDEWGKMMKKRLTRSDVNSLCRLMVPREAMEEQVLSVMGEEMRMSVRSGTGMRVEMVDDDTGRVYKKMVVKMWPSCKCYLINGGWGKYTKARKLRPGDEIGLRWNTRHCRFHITLLKRASE